MKEKTSSSQGNPNMFWPYKIITWLTSQVHGKVKGILCSDWLPERTRWADLVRSGFPVLVPKVKVLFFGHIHICVSLLKGAR